MLALGSFPCPPEARWGASPAPREAHWGASPASPEARWSRAGPGWGVASAGVARAESVVLLNTGHGKGKSSAAFGVMARGWARGWRGGGGQVIKGGEWETRERKLADHLGIE